MLSVDGESFMRRVDLDAYLPVSSSSVVFIYFIKIFYFGDFVWYDDFKKVTICWTKPL